MSLAPVVVAFFWRSGLTWQRALRRSKRRVGGGDIHCRAWEDVSHARGGPGRSLAGHLTQRFDIVARPIPAAFNGQTWAF